MRAATDAICTTPQNAPSVTACGRASSPQRGAEWVAACPSLWRALLRAPCTHEEQDAPAEAAHKGKTGCARFPRLSPVFHSEDSHRRMPGRAIPPVPLPR